MKSKHRVKDLTGKRFGNLQVIGLSDTDTRKTYWVCQCDCGNIKTVRSDSLQSGAIKSCGCLKKKQDKTNLKAKHSHKMSGTRLYEIWQGMKGRCYNVHNARYSRYGGRGISVCDEWVHDFTAFYEWAKSSGYRDDLTIDRIDNNGNYEPENCRWATQEQQARNRTTNINITIGNATKTLTEWCGIFKVDYKKTVARLHRGHCSIDELFN